jgi:uncharacterized protein YcgI (DUF1989 family)
MVATRHAGDGRITLLVPAQGGRAIGVRAGAVVRVVDLEGQQVGDLWVIDADDHDRWLSTSHTRDRLERLFPRVGEQFSDQFGTPILEFVADESPGKHDMLFPPCNRWLCERAGWWTIRTAWTTSSQPAAGAPLTPWSTAPGGRDGGDGGWIRGIGSGDGRSQRRNAI